MAVRPEGATPPAPFSPRLNVVTQCFQIFSPSLPSRVLIVADGPLTKTDHTATNGVVSPTGSAAGRTWRSPSPSAVYAYRTGWLPPSRPASRNTPPLTSPQQHPLHHRGGVDANCTGTSGLHSTGFKSERLKIDLTACDRQTVVRSQRAQFNGHVDSGVVNGCAFESEVASSSSPNQCDVVSESRSGNKWAAERNSSASSSSVGSVPVLATSPSSSSPRVVETLPASSQACNAASDSDNTVVVDQTSSCCSEVAVIADRGVHDDTVIPPCSSVPQAAVVEQHSKEVDGSTTTDVTGCNNDDVKQPSRDAVVTLSPLVPGDLHHDSDLLLSARRTSVDYFQKVPCSMIQFLRFMSWFHRRSQDFVWGRGALFFPQKVDDLYFNVAIKTHAKPTEITSHTAHISPISSKTDSCSALGVHSLPGGALTTFPCKFGPEKSYLRPGGCRCT